jgi:ABC-type transporter MlaC component
MLFAQANRDKVKKDNPDVTFGETGKILGKLWKKASKSDKAKYEAKSAKDKERYTKEMAKYEKSDSSSSEEEESSD